MHVRHAGQKGGNVGRGMAFEESSGRGGLRLQKGESEAEFMSGHFKRKGGAGGGAED